MTKLQVISGIMVAFFYTPGPLFLAFSTHSFLGGLPGLSAPK